MKRLLTSLLTVVLSCALMAQDITGDWDGVLSVQNIKLRLVFHISAVDNGLTATMDSPDQGAFDLPMTSATYVDGLLTLTLNSANITYTGRLDENGVIKGEFKQGPQPIPLDLNRTTTPIEKTLRPQDPAEPFPYKAEEVFFENTDAGIKLAGTLTLPEGKGKFPAIVLISGSGPQNRDEELMGHRPFAVLADFFTRNGIAVLRYDDRGSYASEGDFQSATSVDFATDAAAAVAYLKTRKEINKKKIGLAGHSEGGLIAPMVAVDHRKDVSFIILMAGPGVNGEIIMLEQQELIGRANNMPEEALMITKSINQQIFNLIKSTPDSSVLDTKMDELLHKLMTENPEMAQGADVDATVEQLKNTLLTPWIKFFITHDPGIVLENVKCPVLAINGSLDLQVPSGLNLSAIESSLRKGGNRKFKMVELDGLNHLFQECETGSPTEYANIEQTIAPVAMETMLEWLRKMKVVK